MGRHETQAKRLSQLLEEFRSAMVQEVRDEVEGNASSYFLRKTPFIRDGRRYKDERVAYLEGLERNIADLHDQLAHAEAGELLAAVIAFAHRLNDADAPTGGRVAVAKDFLARLTSNSRWRGP